MRERPARAPWLFGDAGHRQGAEQLQQNAAFLLRAGGLQGPIGTFANGEEIVQPRTYSWAGCYSVANGGLGAPGVGPEAWADEDRPFTENHRYRNLVFDLDNIDSTGALTTGAYVGYDWWTDSYFLGMDAPMSYAFVPPIGVTNIPALLDPAEVRWAVPYVDPAQLGITDSGTAFTLPNGVRNWHGLRLLSVLVAHQGMEGLETHVLAAGGTLPCSNSASYFYPEFEPPVLETVGHYFARGLPGFGLAPDPVPGNPDFCPTNDQPVLLASVGQPAHFMALAKQTVLNGDTNKPVYVERYFDKAYKVDQTGSASDAQTGFLLPSGCFFPTEPGSVGLVTQPDSDGRRGTGVVHVLSLQLDGNNDGSMGLEWAGPDWTTLNQPFLFWINSDHDEPGTGGNADEDLRVPPYPPDYTNGAIRCQRNLEDFARLWACGLPKLPPSQGYSVTLSMSLSRGNPAINLYAAYTNSAAYLTDTNAAAGQFTRKYLGDQLMFDYSWKLGTINVNQSYDLPLSTDGTPQYTNFLFEGTGIGAGELVLTVSQATPQGTNVIAQASAWLDLHHIRDFYERAVITNITTGAIGNWTSAIATVEYPTISDANEAPDILVFVHGMNNTVFDWMNNSETMFKRLRWSGYRGRFATVRWPCKYLPPNALHPFDFNLSEFYGYRSAAAFGTYLNGLRTRFPSHSVHIVAHSQGNAVASEAIGQGAPFDTYILTQGAMPASSYDVNAPTNADLVYADTPPAGEPTPQWQPMGYQGVYTNLTGNIVNFFNTSDHALGWWVSNQRLSKPDGLPGARNYTSDGTNGYAIIDVGLYRLVTDPQECRGMVSRSRTVAVGAQGPVSGQTTQGVIRSAVDLQTQFGFFDTQPEHSAEFTRPLQTVRPYYLQLLRSCQIQPAP